MRFTITPMTLLQIAPATSIDADDIETIAVSVLIYDMFSVGNDTFDVAWFLGALSKEGTVSAKLPGYHGISVVTVQ
jgi:hypothetical protein